MHATLPLCRIRSLCCLHVVGSGPHTAVVLYIEPRCSDFKSHTPLSYAAAEPGQEMLVSRNICCKD